MRAWENIVSPILATPLSLSQELDTSKLNLHAREPEPLLQLIEEKTTARRVGLKPLAVDHQLRDGPLAHVAHHLR